MICSHRFLLSLIHGFKLPWNFFFFFYFHPLCGWVPFSKFSKKFQIFILYLEMFTKKKTHFHVFCCCWLASVLGCITSSCWMNVEFSSKTHPHCKVIINIKQIHIIYKLHFIFLHFRVSIKLYKYNTHENSLTDALLVVRHGPGLSWLSNSRNKNSTRHN